MLSSKEKGIIFKTLTHDFLCKNISIFIKIGCDIPGEYWSEYHFLMHLPMKFELSFYAINNDGKIIGYAISSMKSKRRVYLHHFIVDRDYRGEGVGRLMIEELSRRSRAVFASCCSLKVLSQNSRAISLYESCGFVLTDICNSYCFYKNKLI